MVYVINQPNGKPLRYKKSNEIIMFHYPEQARRYIDRVLGGSPYLSISEWKVKKNG